MFSARLPSRPVVSSFCLLAVPSFVPFRLSSPRFSCRVAGRVSVRAFGWSGVVGRLLAWSVRVCLSWSWSVCLSVCLFHCISFRCGFRCREGGFRAFTAACLVFVFVPSCAFPSALVHLVPCLLLLARLVAAVRFSSRSSRRGGGAAVGDCLLACIPLRLAMSSVSSRSCLSSVRYGERGGDDIGCFALLAWMSFGVGVVPCAVSRCCSGCRAWCGRMR